MRPLSTNSILKDNLFKSTTAIVSLSAVMMSSFSTTTNAAGQDSANMETDTIVVTARKKSESMYDVPISINVVGEQQIEKLGAQDFTDLLSSVPSLTAYQNGPGRTRMFIRGVANGGGNDNDTQNQETVGIYLDEIPLSLGAMNPELTLFDLDRVEVLRGPQGTLYGAGSMAGTVRLVSKKPNVNEYEGKAEANISTMKYGSESYSFKGLVNAPVVEDVFAIRASGYYTQFGGYIDNVATGETDINDGISKGTKIAARLNASENFTADFTFLHHDYTDNGRNEDLDETPLFSRNYTSFDGYDDEIQVYNATLNYDLGWGQIVSSTSYFDRDVINRRSLDLLFELALPPTVTPHELVDSTNSKIFAQEVRLSYTDEGPIQWTIGGYFDKKDTYYLNTFPVPGADAALDISSPDDFGAPVDNLYWGFDDLTVKTFAFFGEAYVDFYDFTLTAGLRYFNWKQDIEFYQSGMFNGGSNSDPRPQGKTDGINPKVNLSYDITDDVLLYTQVARGFRYGGINGAIPRTVCAAELDQVERAGGDTRFFSPDKTWNYEIGTKGTINDGALSFNAAYFHINWNDMQTSRSFECGFGFRENVGKASSDGVEIELNANIGEGLTVSLGGSYVNSRLNEDVANLGAVKGDKAPFIPEFSFNASANYDFPINNEMDGFVWANVQYVGERNTEFSLTAPNNRTMENYAVANLRIGVQWDNVEVSLYADNIFNNKGVVRALRRPPFDPDAVIRVNPQTFGLTTRVDF